MGMNEDVKDGAKTVPLIFWWLFWGAGISIAGVNFKYSTGSNKADWVESCKPDSHQCWHGKEEPKEIYQCCVEKECSGDDDAADDEKEDDFFKGHDCKCDHHFDTGLWPLYLVVLFACLLDFPLIPLLALLSEIATIICMGIIFSQSGKCGMKARGLDVLLMVIKIIEALGGVAFITCYTDKPCGICQGGNLC